jgi:protein-arginine kinase activator protein McsA
MTDKEIRKLAKYIVEELTMPGEIEIINHEGYETKQIGYHLAFFTDKEMQEYEEVLLTKQIEQLQKLLDKEIKSENFEAAAIILNKIKDIEDQIKNQ